MLLPSRALVLICELLPAAQPLPDAEAAEAGRAVNPEATAGFWSTITFGWMSPLMVKARSSRH